MKTGKHQKPAPQRRRRGLRILLPAVAALALVLLILFLPPAGRGAPSAPAEEPVTRDITLEEPEGDFPTPPLSAYDVSLELEDGALSVSGSGAMPALERSLNEEELASVETLTLEQGVTELDPNAFRGCTGLRELTLPEGLTAIGAGAFEGCKLETITIPASVVRIDEGAFRGCTSLREIRVDPGNTAYVSVDGVLYSADRSLLLCFPGAKLSRGYRVPEGVTRIAAQAFSGFQLTDTLYLPASLTELGTDALTRCYGLSAIKFSGDNPAFTAADGVLYDKDRRVLLRYPSGKTSSRFTVPGSVEEIAARAFNENYELTALTLPDGLTVIGDEAFRGCSFLRAVSFPRGLLSIGERAFLSCSRLQELELPDGLESLGGQAFAYCYELGALRLPAGLKDLGSEVFRRCDSLCSVEFPAGSAAVGAGMFRECASLESVRLPDSITAVGAEAFQECRALKTIRFSGTQAQWDALGAAAETWPDGVEIIIEG